VRISSHKMPARRRGWAGWLAAGAAAATIWNVANLVAAQLDADLGAQGDSRAGEPAEASTPPVREFEADSEAILSSDVHLTQTSLRYREVRGAFQGDLTLGHAYLGLAYRPVSFDFLGHPTQVAEHRLSGQLDARYRVASPLTLLAAGSLYDGYADYRSAWLNEYFRQQYAPLPGYREAEPAGRGVQLGAHWEYLPTTGFLQLSATWLRDDIAPGYEIDFSGLRRGRATLDTASYQLTAENVVTQRLRLLQQVRLATTSGRENRYSYQGSANVALGERWVLRGYGGFAFERPTFEAWFAGASLEFELTPAWSLSVAGRYYRDTGEIENSLFSTAAPGLSALQAGVGLRYSWANSTLRFYAAPYVTRYDPFGLGTAFFAGLYRDREWGIVQVAYRVEF